MADSISRGYAIALSVIPAGYALTFFPRILAGMKTPFDPIEPRKLLEDFDQGEAHEADKAFVRRCMAAHQNGFEAMPIYAAGAIAVVATRVDSPWVSRLALLFLGARFAHMACYVLGSGAMRPFAYGRTISFATASTCSFGLLVMSVRKALSK